MTLQDIYDDRSLLKDLFGVYRITNKINGRSYVGQSKDIRRRINKHFSSCFNENNKSVEYYNYPLYQDIRTHGLDAFEFYHESTDMTPEAEAEAIKKYNCVESGYNALKSYGCFDKKEHDRKRPPRTEQKRKYRQENKEAISEYNRKYRQENKEALKKKRQNKYWSDKLAVEFAKDWRE